MLDIPSLLSGARNVRTEYTIQFDVHNYDGNIENIIDETGFFYGKEYELAQCLQVGNITTFTLITRG